MIPLWPRDPHVGWHHVIDNEIFGCFKIWTAFINWVSELWNSYKCSYDWLTSFSNKKTRCLYFMNVHEFRIWSRPKSHDPDLRHMIPLCHVTPTLSRDQKLSLLHLNPRFDLSLFLSVWVKFFPNFRNKKNEIFEFLDHVTVTWRSCSDNRPQRWPYP